ncbi:hypothetical protein BN000_03301 [Mycobacterium europaeum]|uniref:Aminoglycoside phosphotransferase domain-containing protein n=1 Tax=Mycobacterium europaeum TaxID=761804 RepID=A0A0U1DGK3_9MYCO|nr:hypothetical protein [Mycobacterium europaeum]CQD15761.1 hypothetical protein BN000_03301 [Mycobacterium europaeum]
MTSQWAVGDRYGLAFPADPAALECAGARFLTEAFLASRACRDNGITRMTGFREVAGGSTGRKAMLSVEYARPATGLATELFVKFSRDFDDSARDRGKTQMEPEVRFAAFSSAPEFPIAVPRALFADYQRRTGTGILITERIGFGANGIERQYHKCLDYEMPEPLAHYRALVTALARLAGTHRSGRLPGLTAAFPVDVAAATVGERAPLSGDKLVRRVDELAAFAQAHPGLLPELSPEFTARLRDDVPRFARHEQTIAALLSGDSDYVALCHWNANIDNAWFWRDSDGVLRCGLMDWGCVGQMNLGMALWGALSGAETGMWGAHFDELLQLFAGEFHRYGGPELDPARLRRHTVLYAAAMGAAWLLGVPALIRKRFEAIPRSRAHPLIRADESVRAPLQMLSNLLFVWQRHRAGDHLDAALAEGTP